jgi:hypothetical protein
MSVQAVAVAAGQVSLIVRQEEGMGVRLPLTDKQREHLRVVREVQMADWRDGRPQVVDEMFVTDEVVRLMSGMGRACYLGLDGRVWVGNLGEGKRPWVLDNPKEVASCIVRWAGAVGLSELVEALPPMPAGGEACSLCRGTREMPEEIMPRAEDGFRYFCKRCGGLGWTRQAVPDAARDPAT